MQNGGYEVSWMNLKFGQRLALPDDEQKIFIGQQYVSNISVSSLRKASIDKKKKKQSISVYHS